MEPFEQQLQNLWQQGGRDIALSFLRRAVTADMPLGKLMAALNFRDVTNHLGSITLREILGVSDEAEPSSAPASVAPSARQGTRRKRRSADELGAIRKKLVRMLCDEPGSLNTSQMVAGLKAEGFDFDSMRINALLRTLESEGQVSDLGGKPKSWRATSKLRQS